MKLITDTIVYYMHHIDEKFINEIKKELEEKRDKILKELSKITEDENPDPDKWRARFPERGDSEDENAQEVASFSDRLSLQQELKNSFKDIDKALKNIKDGKYGICKHCGQNIKEARLRARPTSTSCIDCKKRLKGED